MTRFRRVLPFGRLMAMALAMLICAAGWVRAQVMDQVPSDALVVLKINHLDKTSAKIGELMQALGVVDFAPPMADPLAAVQSKMGLANGLDKTGDAAIVLVNGAWTAGNTPNPQPMIALMPVSDYKAFLGNATVSATDGDISTLRFKDDPMDVYAVNWGGYAAIAPVKANLAKKPDGLKVAGLAAKQIGEKDAVIYVNMPAVKGVLLPMLQKNRQMWVTDAKDAMARTGQNEPNKGALLETLLNQVFDAGESLLSDTQAVTVGISVSKSGVNTTMLAEFMPDSYEGKLCAQIKGTDAPLLSGLPSTKYLVYGGGIQDPAVVTKVFDDIVNPYKKPLADMGDSGTKILSAVESYRDAFATVEGTAFGMVAPTGPVGQGALIQFIGTYKADAQKLKDAQEKQLTAQADIMKAMGARNAPGLNTTVTPNAKTVEGVSFDQIKMQMTMAGNTPEAMQANQMLSIMYGPGGMSMFTGVVDPKTLLFASGVNDDVLTAGVASAKGNTNPMGESDPVKLVDAELPKNRAFVVYVPLDVIVSTAVGYAQQFGFPLPVQLPPNLPPIGISAGTEGSAFREDWHIPTPLVQSLVQAGMQFWLQHGGQPAGGGGL